MSVSRREFLLQAAAAAAAVNSADLLRAEPAGKPKIVTGQIGTGHAHASGKLQAMLKLKDDYQVVGVVETDPRRRGELERTGYHGVPLISEEQLFSTPGLQVVAIETAVEDSAAAALRCVEAGFHIHLDKPGGASAAAFKKIYEAAARRNVTVQMGYMLRYNPAFEFLFRACREGWLGDLFELHAVMSKTVGDSARKQLAQFAGGSMFELGCHIIDAALTVLGPPAAVTPFVRRTRPEKDSLADNCLAVLEYPRATATMRSALIEFDGGQRRQFSVCGTEGTIEIRPLESGTVQLAFASPHESFPKGRQMVQFPRDGGRYDGEFRDLAAVVRGEKELAWTPEHDLAVHETVLRASGMPVDQ